MTGQLDRIERMLAALCNHLGIERETTLLRDTVTDVGVEPGRRYVGMVSKFEHGWGFIECAQLKQNVFVYYRDIEGSGLRSLDAGEEVSFEVGPGKDGRPKAVQVRRQQPNQKSSQVHRDDAHDSVPHDDGSRAETHGEDGEGEDEPQ